ncbi:hypothetical protein BJX76DRAFT_358518 [Aspergillus varians]
MRGLSPIRELDEPPVHSSPRDALSKHELLWRRSSQTSVPSKYDPSCQRREETRFEPYHQYPYPYPSYYRPRRMRAEPYQRHEQAAERTQSWIAFSQNNSSGHVKFDPEIKGDEPLGSASRPAPALSTSTPQMYSAHVNAEATAIQMTVKGYVDKVKALREKEVKRQVGSGTLDDPLIVWIGTVVDRPRGRVAGIEKVCREACLMKRSTKLWIRRDDHNTTRTFSRTITGTSVKKILPDDPHITAYLGESIEYDYEGHIYCGYTEEAPMLPCRLARPEERQYNLMGDLQPLTLLNRMDLREKAHAIGFLPLTPIPGKSQPTSTSTSMSKPSPNPRWNTNSISAADTTGDFDRSLCMRRMRDANTDRPYATDAITLVGATVN